MVNYENDALNVVKISYYKKFTYIRGRDIKGG